MSDFINGDRVSVNGVPATVYDVNNGSMQVILDGQKGWIRVATSSVSKLEPEPTFKKGDAVLLELPEGTGIGWIVRLDPSDSPLGDLYTVSLHMGHKTPNQLANGHYRVFKHQLTELEEIPFPQGTPSPPPHSGSKYLRPVKLIGDKIDVYAVLDAFDVRCPARQHAIKKLLCAGIRGKGDVTQDLQEAADAISRAIELAKVAS